MARDTALDTRSLLDVRGLTTTFVSRGDLVTAVDDVSFDVREGEVYCLVGESGCGKSVTVLSVMGLIAPPGQVMHGEVLFGGRDLRRLSRKEMARVCGNDISLVFQDPMTSLNPVHTVGRQIGESLRLHRGSSRSEARKRAIELLDLVGVPAARQRVDDYPHQFSGGMRQRAVIAMALACDPKLLIADEPTTALDVTVQAQIIELLDRLRRDLRMAVLLITHDLGLVAGIADRVSVMYAGRIVESGMVSEFFRSPRHPYTLGLMSAVPRVDQARGGRLIPISGRPPQLTNIPPGCRFAPRCPRRMGVCTEEEPALRSVDGGHVVACWAELAAPAEVGSGDFSAQATESRRRGAVT